MTCGTRGRPRPALCCKRRCPPARSHSCGRRSRRAAIWKRRWLSCKAISGRTRQFDRYTGIFLFVEPEEQYGGPVLHLPAGEWLTVCYRGTHAHSAPSYELLLDEAARRGFELAEDSVEVTHIDAGFTSDETQYLTELQVPVKKSENTS